MLRKGKRRDSAGMLSAEEEPVLREGCRERAGQIRSLWVGYLEDELHAHKQMAAWVSPHDRDVCFLHRNTTNREGISQLCCAFNLRYNAVEARTTPMKRNCGNSIRARCRREPASSTCVWQTLPGKQGSGRVLEWKRGWGGGGGVPECSD